MSDNFFYKYLIQLYTNKLEHLKTVNSIILLYYSITYYHAVKKFTHYHI